ncbi:MAG: transcriptional repressor [Actinobacteria bacterium]|nr:transcriptional repressor [Actinomycetota bacterium]
MSHHATRTLQELGYRLTPQRTLVWDALREAGGHLGAEEICARVQTRFPNVNISTVYRTLELLVELGLVRETVLGSDRRYYEVEEEVPHHHLVCDGCGRVLHVHNEDLGGLTAGLLRNQGFRLREMTAFGYCRECAAAGGPHGDRAADGAEGGGDHAHP